MKIVFRGKTLEIVSVKQKYFDENLSSFLLLFMMCKEKQKRKGLSITVSLVPQVFKKLCSSIIEKK